MLREFISYKKEFATKIGTIKRDMRKVNVNFGGI